MAEEIASILDSTKKLLGFTADYTAFDNDLVLHINATLEKLNQLGVGPTAGFEIHDNTATWDQFLGGDPRLNSAKTYVYLNARLIFDPPQQSWVLAAWERQIKEAEWRLQVRVEDLKIASPISIDGGTPSSPDGPILVWDGGAP